MNEFVMPVIALVGRPNVGKSTLFNLLTRTRNSLVADQPGVTRDRQYGLGKEGPCPYWLIDTGGMLREDEALDSEVDSQARLAIDEADIVFFLVDAKDGIAAADEDILKHLRQQQKEFHLLVNKTDYTDTDTAMSEFYALGVKNIHGISATQKYGVKEIMADLLRPFAKHYQAPSEDDVEPKRLNLTVVGRPNAGKSTLINRFLGETRVIASDIAGTTRDSIAIPFEYQDQQYTLVDTAGIRRKSKTSEFVEKISVVKTLQAIDKSNVVLLMLDAHEGIADLDAHLLGLVVEAGKALVIAVNKWDHLSEYERERRKIELDRKLSFVDYADIHFISALHGTGIRDVLTSVKKAYQASFISFSSNQLTKTLQQIMHKHQPPLVNGYAVKLRYAHQGGKNPPIIVLHGSRVSKLPHSYQRYLEKTVREHYQLFGTPIKIQLKDTENPYAKV